MVRLREMHTAEFRQPHDALTLPADLELMQALWSVDHALDVMSRRMIRRLGITGPQRLVIRLLGQFPGASPGELAKLLRLHPATVSGVLKRLERRRLVMRVSDPWDGRKSQIRLTRKGEALDKPDADTVESAIGRVLSRLPRRHVELARRVLTALEEELTR